MSPKPIRVDLAVRALTDSEPVIERTFVGDCILSVLDELARVSRNRDMWKAQVERQALDLAAFREVLTDIAVCGCGMLNQPAAMNGPNELWLGKRIREYERRAADVLNAAISRLTPNPQEPK